MYDLLIVGAGPAGIFTALEAVNSGKNLKIAMVEQGVRVEKRSCPKSATGKCMFCRPYCHITAGFSGAGAFSDGKLSLSTEVGGDLPELIGNDVARNLLNYTDKIYLSFGADTKIEGVGVQEKVKGIRRNAIRAGLKLVDCPIRHLGTEKAHSLYADIEEYLLSKGVEIFFSHTCTDLLFDKDVCTGAVIKPSGKESEEKTLYSAKTVVATGRKGADWLERMCRKHGIAREPGVVDIGVRVEVRNEVMEEVNNVLYESKLIGYPEPFKDKVRTFCQNPGGFVAQENYDGNLAVVNGHSFKNTKSSNTNLAILCSHRFCDPFDRPIDYARKVGELCNMLGDGHIVVQRLGDILGGKRTWKNELDRSNVYPTLPDAEPGDVTSALPYRTMCGILGFLKAADAVVPGIAADETLLYAPEIKFYSNRVKMDKNLKTNKSNLYCLGDSSGWTRGLMMASVMGVYAARKLLEEKD